MIEYCQVVGWIGQKLLEQIHSKVLCKALRYGTSTCKHPKSTLLSAAEGGDAHLLVGLAPGLVSGAALVLRPHDSREERVVVHEAWLRNDGLVVLLKEPCLHSHPVGAHVYLAPPNGR